MARVLAPQALVEDLYRTLLGREADAEGLLHHAATVQRDGAIAGTLAAILGSDECSAREVDRWRERAGATLASLAGGAAPAAAADDPLARAVSAAQLLDAMAEASRPAKLQERAWSARNARIRFRPTAYARLETPLRLGIVFVASESWLPFALAVADAVRRSHHCRTVLAYDQWSPSIGRAPALCGSVHEVVSATELAALPLDVAFRPVVLFTHSFGWLPTTRSLLCRFPAAALCVYGDGFKNEVDDVLQAERAIGGALCFGYRPQETPVRALATIPAGRVLHYVERCARQYEFAANLPPGAARTPYAAVYLRYWGQGPYAFPLEDVVECVVRTIERGVPADLELVIKPDARADAQLMRAVGAALDARGRAWRPLGDELLRLGIDSACEALPVEYLLARDALTDARAHVVFDSSLSYLIALSPRVRVPTRIVIGADLDALRAGQREGVCEDVACDSHAAAQRTQERGEAPRSRDAGLRTIAYYSQRYSSALASARPDAIPVDCGAAGCFAFDLPPRGGRAAAATVAGRP